MPQHMTCFVTIAETRTGIVIHAGDGRRHREGDGDPRSSFENEQAAVDFSQQHVCVFPERECIVTDQAGACLHVFRIARNGCVD